MLDPESVLTVCHALLPGLAMLYALARSPPAPLRDHLVHMAACFCSFGTSLTFHHFTESCSDVLPIQGLLPGPYIILQLTLIPPQSMLSSSCNMHFSAFPLPSCKLTVNRATRTLSTASSAVPGCAQHTKNSTNGRLS